MSRITWWSPRGSHRRRVRKNRFKPTLRPAVCEPLESRELMAAGHETIAAVVRPKMIHHAASAHVAERSLGALRVVERIADQTYSRDGSKLDVYVPTGRTPPPGGWPAIVAIPGGGWRWSSKGDYGRAVAGMGKYGYVVVAIDYAYDSPGGRSTWPANIQDVRAAIRWMRKNADRLNVDPNKIVAMGESAGGHLAALAGVLPDGPVSEEGTNAGASPRLAGQVSSRVQAVVDFYGPTNLIAEWELEPEVRPYLRSFLGGSPGQIADRYVAASPLSHVSSDDPPTFIVQGTADRVIPISQSIDFAAALRDAGVPASLNLLPGVPHGFRFKLNSANMRLLLDFLDEALGHLSGASR